METPSRNSCLETQKGLQDFYHSSFSTSLQFLADCYTLSRRKTPLPMGILIRLKNKVRAELRRANLTDCSILSISDYKWMSCRCHCDSERLSMRTAPKGKREEEAGSCCWFHKGSALRCPRRGQSPNWQPGELIKPCWENQNLGHKSVLAAPWGQKSRAHMVSRLVKPAVISIPLFL